MQHYCSCWLHQYLDRYACTWQSLAFFFSSALSLQHVDIRELPPESIAVKVFTGLERWRPPQGNNDALLGKLGGYPADVDRPVKELN